MAVSLTRRLANRFQLQANYTLARNMDDDSNEHLFRRETALNPFDVAPEWAYSKNDVRHNVNFNALADIPGGFTAGGQRLSSPCQAKRTLLTPFSSYYAPQ